MKARQSAKAKSFFNEEEKGRKLLNDIREKSKGKSHIDVPVDVDNISITVKEL